MTSFHFFYIYYKHNFISSTYFNFYFCSKSISLLWLATLLTNLDAQHVYSAQPPSNRRKSAAYVSSFPSVLNNSHQWLFHHNQCLQIPPSWSLKCALSSGLWRLLTEASPKYAHLEYSNASLQDRTPSVSICPTRKQSALTSISWWSPLMKPPESRCFLPHTFDILNIIIFPILGYLPVLRCTFMSRHSIPYAHIGHLQAPHMGLLNPVIAVLY